jgi:hypothetical protein
MSQAYHTKPSDVLGVGGFAAFAIDRGIHRFAITIEREQDIAAGRLPSKAKEATVTHVRQRVLDAFLNVETVTTPGRFADPAAK